MHVVIGLYGLVLSDVSLFSSRKKALKKAKLLCAEYDLPFKNTSNNKAYEWYSGNDENEVHVVWNVPLSSGKTIVVQSSTVLRDKRVWKT